jgi:hypothetical protein
LALVRLTLADATGLPSASVNVPVIVPVGRKV